MVIQEPVRLRANDKLFSVLRVVRTSDQQIALSFKEELEADTLIRHNSNSELWYICNEIKDAVYRDLDESIGSGFRDNTSNQPENNT